jgi:hypothetical protein
LERKNNKRKNSNVHVLQHFGLYNKYNLLDHQMSKKKDWVERSTVQRH